MPRLKVGEIMGKEACEASTEIKKRVEKARSVQRERFSSRRIRCNAELETRDLEKHCSVSSEGQALLKMAIQELGFSARAYHKCLKVARTIADLEGSQAIEPQHVSESIHYRSLDRTQGII